MFNFTHMRSVLLVCAVAARLSAQSGADRPLAFDVASVKPSTPDETPYSNIPLGPGDAYVASGGRFIANGFPVITYFAFAHKIMGNEVQSLLPRLPQWVTTERFDIQARAEGNPTKDQMRLMVRSLLADRFRLSSHYETRQVPVFALVLSKAGKTGPQFRQHPDDPACSVTIPAGGSAQALEGGLPAVCGGIFALPFQRAPAETAGRLRFGARNVGLQLITNFLAVYLDRPVLDQTGLGGNFDFTLEWTPEARGSGVGGGESQNDPSGTTLMEALNEQLGLKLVSQKGPIDAIVLDHVERPSGN
jgi:uncharacterized protein (TIGR03435 family)